jgi:uncharacterized membrane protein (UPF0127 family)
VFLKSISIVPLLGCLLAGCARETVSPPRFISMQIGSGTFRLEVADTDAQREQGLMHRESMPEDQGMIFVFQHRHFASFWMRNTLIPLDILFVDRDGTIVNIRGMNPRDETLVQSTAPVLYAIELNAGAAQRVGVREGDKLQLGAITSR